MASTFLSIRVSNTLRLGCFVLLFSSALWARPWSEIRPEAIQLVNAPKPSAEKLVEYCEMALRGRDPELAVALAQAASKAQPKQVKPRALLVKSLLFAGKSTQAREQMPTLLELSQRAPEVLSLDGMLSIDEGQPAQAVISLEEALATGRKQNLKSEDMGNMANILLVALYQSGQKPQALERSRQFLVDFPEEPDLWLSAGRLYREAGQFQAALETSQKAILRFPEIANFWAAKALAEKQLGQKEASEASFAELRGRDPDLAKALRPILDGQAPDQAQIQLQLK